MTSTWRTSTHLPPKAGCEEGLEFLIEIFYFKRNYKINLKSKVVCLSHIEANAVVMDSDN